MATERRPLLMHLPVPWVFVIAYFVGVVLQGFLPVELPPTAHHIARVAGFILLPSGVVLAAWSLTIFRRQRTTTIPGEQSRALVTWGPYRFSRNPMYVSLTLAYLGEAGLLVQVWPLLPLVAVLVYLNWTLIPIEEGRLQETFGAVYSEYRAQVRRWF
ncbi:MAG TPA: isoprenylcysteine carboxylmethyltransferase family protein [Gemmatimonadales bacterium]|nr:isoprenylcysteine carboxylmethyltransferase family protein [Gemmatimonadales bacterium]